MSSPRTQLRYILNRNAGAEVYIGFKYSRALRLAEAKRKYNVHGSCGCSQFVLEFLSDRTVA